MTKGESLKKELRYSVDYSKFEHKPYFEYM